MSQDREIERVLDQWFGAGPGEVPDRVIDAVADRIEHQTQRPAWRLHWKEPHVTSTIRLTASAAAILIAIVGVAILGRFAAPGIGRGDQGPIPIASAPAATSTPTPSRAAATQGQVTVMGIAYDRPSGWKPVLDTKDVFLLTIPGTADDWGEGVWILINPVISEDVPCSAIPAAGIGHGVDDLVRGIRARPELRTSTPVPIAIGGLHGVSLDVSVQPTWSGTCPGDGRPTVTYLTQDHARPETWSTGGLEQQRIALLDDGRGNVILVAINVQAMDDVRLDMIARQAAPIIDSLSFPVFAATPPAAASSQP